MLQHKFTNVATNLKVFISAADPGLFKMDALENILKIFIYNQSLKWIIRSVRFGSKQNPRSAMSE